MPSSRAAHQSRPVPPPPSTRCRRPSRKPTRPPASTVAGPPSARRSQPSAQRRKWSPVTTRPAGPGWRGTWPVPSAEPAGGAVGRHPPTGGPPRTSSAIRARGRCGDAGQQDPDPIEDGRCRSGAARVASHEIAPGPRAEGGGGDGDLETAHRHDTVAEGHGAVGRPTDRIGPAPPRDRCGVDGDRWRRRPGDH